MHVFSADHVCQSWNLRIVNQALLQVRDAYRNVKCRKVAACELASAAVKAVMANMILREAAGCSVL